MDDRATQANMPQVVKASLKGDCLYLIRMGIRMVYKESVDTILTPHGSEARGKLRPDERKADITRS